jgi:predicted PurR-regulated permease PerM
MKVNSNVKKLLRKRVSAVFLTVVLLTMAIVPSFAMATDQLEENANGGGV